MKTRGTILAATCLAAPASAQIGWAEFERDNSLLSGPATVGVNDVQEKDYAWDDLDNDGDIDLVVVRKQPYTTPGRFPNVLYMNEGGVLVNRTAQFAGTSDFPGDNGFLTPTNDRDVIIADVTGDGWLDVVTSTAIGPNQPKVISHPRVYVNLGEDPQGNWLGIHFEESRIPDLGTFPNFCGIGAGDVDDDGDIDLYFAHYEQSAQVDLNDRLFINDGTGFFADESTMRMTSTQLASSFAVSANIADMNGDGYNDIVKDTALGSTGASGPRVTVTYNDPNNPGTFPNNLYTEPYTGAPYHANVGDLNNDGRLDMVIADDGNDRYMLNEGNDPFGRVIWSAAYSYNTDDGFGSNNLVADIDGDGWNDVIICDVDVDIPSCSRRLHIYRNRAPGQMGNGQMFEESGSGFRGVSGMTTSDMRGTHDVAIFDLDGDGDNDMIIGRCTGTDIWVNQEFTGPTTLGERYCTPATQNSTAMTGYVSASGSMVASDNDLTLTATQLPTNQFGYFLASETQAQVFQPGGAIGYLCVGGTIARFNAQVQNTGNNGSMSIMVDLTNMPAPVAPNVVAGQTWNFQAWFRDVIIVPTSGFTDAISLTFQ